MRGAADGFHSALRPLRETEPDGQPVLHLLWQSLAIKAKKTLYGQKRELRNPYSQTRKPNFIRRTSIIRFILLAAPIEGADSRGNSKSEKRTACRGFASSGQLPRVWIASG